MGQRYTAHLLLEKKQWLKIAREVKIIEIEAVMKELMSDGTVWTPKLGDRLKVLQTQLNTLKEKV